MNTPQMLKPSQVAERLNVSLRHVDALVESDPTFPRPVVISPRCRRFDAADLEQWIVLRTQPAGATQQRVALPRRRSTG